MKLLSQVDIYRQEPKLKIKGEESIGSIVGGIFTIIYVVVILAFAIYTLIPIANRQNFTYQLTSSTSPASNATFNTSNFNFFVEITGLPKTLTDFKSMFFVHAYQVTYNASLAVTDEVNGGETTQIITMSKCTQNNFNSDGWNSFQNMKLGFTLCPNSSFSANMSYFQDSDDYDQLQYIKVQVRFYIVQCYQYVSRCQQQQLSNWLYTDQPQNIETCLTDQQLGEAPYNITNKTNLKINYYYLQPQLSFQDANNPVDSFKFNKMTFPITYGQYDNLAYKQVSLSFYNVTTDSTWTANTAVESLINTFGYFLFDSSGVISENDTNFNTDQTDDNSIDETDPDSFILYNYVTFQNSLLVKTYSVKFDSLIDLSVQVQGLMGPLGAVFPIIVTLINGDLVIQYLYKKMYKSKKIKNKKKGIFSCLRKKKSVQKQELSEFQKYQKILDKKQKMKYLEEQINLDNIVNNNLEQDTIRNILFTEKSEDIFKLFRNPGPQKQTLKHLQKKIDKIKCMQLKGRNLFLEKHQLKIQVNITLFK